MASKFSTAMLTSLTTAAIAIPGIAYAQHDASVKKSSQKLQADGQTLSSGKSPIPSLKVEEIAKDGKPSKNTNMFKDGKPPEGELTPKTVGVLKDGGTSKPEGAPSGLASGITNDLKFTRYHEEGNRYNINVWQNLLIVPINDFKFTLELQRDSQSGASSYVIRPNNLQDPTLTPPYQLYNSRSGATIVDDRNQVTLTSEYDLKDSKYGVTLYHSSENDFLSTGVGASGTWNFNKNNTVLNLSASASSQNVRPTLAGWYSGSQMLLGRIAGNNTIQKYYTSLKQDLSMYNYVQLSTEFEHQGRYLAEPYKFVAIYGDARNQGIPFYSYTAPNALYPAGVTQIRQKYPASRNIWTPMLRFVQFVPWTEGAAHFDYRFSGDSWGITSNTFEFSYYQPFLENWEIVPLYRYYTQSAANFYGPTFSVASTPSPFPAKQLTRNAFSGDYRLARFGSMSYEIKVSYQAFSQMKLGLTAGYYKRRADYSMSSKDPIPHLEIDGSGVGSTYFGLDFNFKF